MAEKIMTEWAKQCKLRSPNRKHGFTTGETRPRVYIIWKGMRARCRDEYYTWYVGRGIKICDRWMESFENFLKDMGHPPTDSHTLDRIDNNGNYELSNCRWATAKEQANNRTSSRYLEHNGTRLTVAQWADKVGLQMKTLHARLQSGWGVHDALTTPVRPRKNPVNIPTQISS